MLPETLGNPWKSNPSRSCHHVVRDKHDTGSNRTRPQAAEKPGSATPVRSARIWPALQSVAGQLGLLWLGQRLSLPLRDQASHQNRSSEWFKNVAARAPSRPVESETLGLRLYFLNLHRLRTSALIMNPWLTPVVSAPAGPAHENPQGWSERVSG